MSGWWTGAILTFCLFIGLCALFIGWAIDAGQKSLDRRFAEDDQAMREAMRRWPP